MSGFQGCTVCVTTTRFCHWSTNGSKRQYVNEWVWLCSNKTLFIQTVACRLQFANPWARLKKKKRSHLSLNLSVYHVSWSWLFRVLFVCLFNIYLAMPGLSWGVWDLAACSIFSGHHVGSHCSTRVWTPAPALGAWSLRHWTIWEVFFFSLKWSWLRGKLFSSIHFGVPHRV